jgi:hypothetical protein
MGRKLKELRAEVAKLKGDIQKLWKALGKRDKPGKTVKPAKKAAKSAKKAVPKKKAHPKSAPKHAVALPEPDPVAAALEAQNA